ncbi:MAG: hypothetical protein IJO26_03890 [Clostridium sp.]|nr:hypothetical protein [Clostridium sp.]
MFGYVTPLKAELKVKDFTRFRSYYCGLCLHIKDEVGNLPRMTLNYDMTFLGVLLDALSAKETNFELKRCLVHPIEKKTVVINNSALKYAAAMNLTLYYYKIRDDIDDDNNFKSKVLEKILYPYQKKISTSLKEIENNIKDNLNNLRELENNKNFTFIDEISHPFSDIVGSILKYYPEELIDDSSELRDNLYNLGYTLGKWIYLIDALDDLEKDIEANKFNPINFLYNKNNLSYKDLLTHIKDRLEFSILNSSYNCKNILEILPLQKNEDILKNILELGMMDRYLSILNKASEDKRSDKK